MPSRFAFIGGLSVVFGAFSPCAPPLAEPRWSLSLCPISKGCHMIASLPDDLRERQRRHGVMAEPCCAWTPCSSCITPERAAVPTPVRRSAAPPSSTPGGITTSICAATVRLSRCPDRSAHRQRTRRQNRWRLPPRRRLITVPVPVPVPNVSTACGNSDETSA